MNWVLNQLALYFSYPFVRYAIISGVLIALCSSLLGVILVLKRYSYIGDGLSHVSFGALAVASILHLGSFKLIFILPITITAAILILKNGNRQKMNSDAVIAMLSVSSLALGYLLMNIYSVSANVSGDVCSTLFGSTSILTLTKNEVWICSIFSVVVSAFYIVMYRKIFSVTFDESFAEATGTQTQLYNTIIAVIIAVTIVLAMELVGSLLISALIIFPSVTSMQLFHSFKAVSISSAVFAVGCTVSGMLTAILAGTPVGATIVATDTAVFFLVRIYSLLKK